jgi:hypothetical protein
MEILKKALLILKDRGAVYGGVEDHFTRAAKIASLWLDKPVTARDVSMILASVKMARISTTPDHEDSFVDLCNYVAFAASFSGNGKAPEKEPVMPQAATLSSSS